MDAVRVNGSGSSVDGDAGSVCFVDACACAWRRDADPPGAVGFRHGGGDGGCCRCGGGNRVGPDAVASVPRRPVSAAPPAPSAPGRRQGQEAHSGEGGIPQVRCAAAQIAEGG